jgi:hypothetical protein
MQKSAGMRRVGGGTFEFPDSMKPFTEPVPYALYEITREEWERRALTMSPPTSAAGRS